MAGYDLGPLHPLRPERFTLAVSLMSAYGLLSPPAPRGGPVIRLEQPRAATQGEIETVHDPGYVAAVMAASADPRSALDSRRGIGTIDTPAFAGMHEAAALVVGGTLAAVRDVSRGATRRAFSIAGGLHHAHRDSAAGFCVYNDCAIAIAVALRADPNARIVYIDIDAHHGDGVQEAFWSEPRVLTISLHESGDRLFPGTGWTGERGSGRGKGATLNVPLPEGATDECYEVAFDQAVEPAVRAFGHHLIVAQCGADAHHADPLTTLGMTIRGHARVVERIVTLADETCDGRLVACGGGGYGWQHVVPRCWTLLAARLAGAPLPDELPQAWRDEVRRTSGVEAPLFLLDDPYEVTAATRRGLLDRTSEVCAQAMSLSPR